MKNRFVGAALGCLLAVGCGSAGICGEATLEQNLAYVKILDGKLAASPNDQNLLLQHAELMGKLSQFSRMLQDANSLAKNYPKLRFGYLFQAEAYGKLERYKEAIKSLNLAFALQAPNNSEIIGMASYLREDKNYAEALKLLNRVISQEPKNSTAYINRALTYYYLHGNCKEAQADLDKTILLEPNNMAARALLKQIQTKNSH